MIARKRIYCVVGTRPEVIKMAPVILDLRARSWAEVSVLATAQHRDLLDRALEDFGLHADDDLDAMRPGQGLSELTARLLASVDARLERTEPDLVLAQGDTTTVFATALACFYRAIPFGHVEAGLRTFDMASPFPEEFNRVATSRIARLHFAPTATARANLLGERVPDGDIVVTGNTVIDALMKMQARAPALPIAVPEGADIVLVTVHRRENFGAPLRRIFEGILRLVARFPTLHVVYPVHPNPNVLGCAREMLGGRERIHLCAPLSYAELVAVLGRCRLVLTDSGGLQEEAPALGKPVLVLRNETERPEAVACGAACLIGTDPEVLLDRAGNLLTRADLYERMSRAGSPFGDGQAASRIGAALEGFFGVGVETTMMPPSLPTQPAGAAAAGEAQCSRNQR